MMKRIDALITELEDVCNEFDEFVNVESNWHVACRISTYTEHVNHGIEGLQEMRQYLSRLSKWQLAQIQEGYRAN